MLLSNSSICPRIPLMKLQLFLGFFKKLFQNFPHVIWKKKILLNVLHGYVKNMNSFRSPSKQSLRTCLSHFFMQPSRDSFVFFGDHSIASFGNALQVYLRNSTWYSHRNTGISYRIPPGSGFFQGFIKIFTLVLTNLGISTGIPFRSIQKIF